MKSKAKKRKLSAPPPAAEQETPVTLEAESAAAEPVAVEPEPLAPEPAESAEAFPRREVEAAIPGAKSVTLACDEAGRVDWTQTPEDSLRLLRSLCSDPENYFALGIAAPVSVPAAMEEAWVGPLYDALGKIEALGAHFLLKMSYEKCERVCSFTEAEKAQLAPVTARVVNKHAPVWLKESSDEFALVVLLGTITAQKVQRLVELGRADRNTHAQSHVQSEAGAGADSVRANGSGIPSAVVGDSEFDGVAGRA